MAATLADGVVRGYAASLCLGVRLSVRARALGPRGPTCHHRPMSTRAALGIWTLALLCAAGAILLIATSDQTDNKLALILLATKPRPVGAASRISASLLPG